MRKTVWIWSSSGHEIMAFSSQEKLMQYAQEMYPNKKSLRLMNYILDHYYVLVNHNSHFLPFYTHIYEVEIDTGEKTYSW